MHPQRNTQLNADLTLIFDEVDSGIGGTTGDAVARRLKQLSGTNQVIVVTHLAQVAAYADMHYVVTRTACADGLPSTTVQEVTGAQRIDEVARMLAGNVDEVARNHAAALLDAARG